MLRRPAACCSRARSRSGAARSITSRTAPPRAASSAWSAPLARALAPKVLVNGVAPGIMLTGMPEHLLDVPERRERLLAETTLKRFGEAREVATVIRFLLSDDSSFITGQVINVDGGVVYS